MTTTVSDSGERPRALVAVVDDDGDVRASLSGALGAAGYDVTEAANGLRLVSALEVDEPSLILLDVNMSWIDGFELCRALKRNDQFAKIPVVFISGRTDERAVELAMDAGAEGYFPKPLDLRELLDCIRELVKTRS